MPTDLPRWQHRPDPLGSAEVPSVTVMDVPVQYHSETGMPGIAAGGAPFESIVKNLTDFCALVREPLRLEVALNDTEIGSENWR